MRWIFVFFATSLCAAGPYCTTLFPAIPCIDDSCNSNEIFWTADVSILAWQAQEEGLNFAFKNNPLPIIANTNVNGDLVGVDFNWEPAFKIILGTSFASRAWDTRFRWTYFHTHSSETVHAQTNTNSSGLFPMFAYPTANIATQFLYGTARGALDLTLNGFDIEMGYDPFLSPTLSLRLNAGVKVASIHQDFNVEYSDGFNDGINQLLDARTALTNKTIGAGPRIGFDSMWRCGYNFSLLASVAGSLPLVFFRVNRSDEDLGIRNQVQQTVNSIFRESFWVFRPILETSLGLGWDTCFCCKYPFGIAAKYEFQFFSEQNMMPMLVNPGILTQVFPSRGDLYLHGATLNFHFGF